LTLPVNIMIASTIAQMMPPSRTGKPKKQSKLKLVPTRPRHNCATAI